MKVIISLLFSLILLSSCEDSRTGCQDFYASNYDFGAVDACDSCCVFPDFNMDFEFKFDELTYSTDSIYLLLSRDSIQFKSLQIVFSDFRFVESDNEYTIIDTVQFNNMTILNNYLLLRSNRTSSNIGHTNYGADFDQLKFNLGFDNKIQDIDAINSFSEDGQLKIALDSMYVDSLSELRMMEFSFILEDSLRTINFSNEIVEDIVYDVDGIIVPGRDWKLKMTVDFSVLVNDVSSAMTNNEIKDRILDNLLASISVE